MNTRNEPAPPVGTWIRSSRCGPNGGNCVELNYGHEVLVGVRDSKADPKDPRILNFHRTAWTAFLARM